MGKQALCIGINDYLGTANELFGCVDDANGWAAELDRRRRPCRLVFAGETSWPGCRRYRGRALPRDSASVLGPGDPHTVNSRQA